MEGKMKIMDDGDEVVAERRRPNYYHHRWSLMGKNAAGFNIALPSFDQQHILLGEDENDEPYYGSELKVKVEDFEGNEIYTISLIDACTKRTVETLVGVTNSFEWANEKALVYIAREKKTHRPYKVNSSSFFLLLQIIKYVSYIVKHLSI